MYLKTTTEGYIILKQYNDSIKEPRERPLSYASIQRTSSGFYKIEFDDIKWYRSYAEINNFMEGLAKLDEQDIPYSFIRLGEDVTDIEYNCHWTDDIPYEIESFEPVIDVNDDDYCSYEDIEEKEE